MPEVPAPTTARSQSSVSANSNSSTLLGASPHTLAGVPSAQTSSSAASASSESEASAVSAWAARGAATLARAAVAAAPATRPRRVTGVDTTDAEVLIAQVLSYAQAALVPPSGVAGMCGPHVLTTCTLAPHPSPMRHQLFMKELVDDRVMPPHALLVMTWRRPGRACEDKLGAGEPAPIRLARCAWRPAARVAACAHGVRQPRPAAHACGKATRPRKGPPHNLAIPDPAHAR